MRRSSRRAQALDRARVRIVLDKRMKTDRRIA
jgi:hypothetical protein